MFLLDAPKPKVTSNFWNINVIFHLYSLTLKSANVMLLTLWRFEKVLTTFGRNSNYTCSTAVPVWPQMSHMSSVQHLALADISTLTHSADTWGGWNTCSSTSTSWLHTLIWLVCLLIGSTLNTRPGFIFAGFDLICVGDLPSNRHRAFVSTLLI